jgi:hypothetical protein
MVDEAADTLRFITRGRLLVFVNLDQTPTDAEWASYHFVATEVAREHGMVRIFVATEGGAPTAKQRRIAGERSTSVKSRTAVVTDRFVARAAVTALAWLNLDIKIFSRGEQAKAFAFLELSAEECDWVRGVVPELQAKLRESRAGRRV